jgi:hypothetical protein
LNAKQSIIKSSRKPKKADSKLALQTTTVLEPPKQEKKEPTQAPKTKKGPKEPAQKHSFLKLFDKPVEPEAQVVLLKEPPATAELVDIYTIQVPYSQVSIYSLQELGGGKAYFINEVKLSDDEKALLKKSHRNNQQRNGAPKKRRKPHRLPKQRSQTPHTEV